LTIHQSKKERNPHKLISICYLFYKKNTVPTLRIFAARPERTRRADWRESTLARRLCFAKSSAARSWATSASTSKRGPLKATLSYSLSAIAFANSTQPACYPWTCAFNTHTHTHTFAPQQPTNQQQPCNDPANTLPHPTSNKKKKRNNRKKNKKMEGEEANKKKEFKESAHFPLPRIFCVD
jgi:hypothetical protein